MNPKQPLDSQSITLIKSFVTGDVIIGNKTINFDATANTARQKGHLEATIFFLSLFGVFGLLTLTLLFIYNANNQALIFAFPLFLIASVVGVIGYQKLNEKRANRYKQVLARVLKTTTLSFMAKPIDLEKDYVSLALRTEYVSRDDLAESASKLENDQEVISAETALDTFKFLLILGEPGAGKTTLLKHYAVKHSRLSDWLPIFVRLTDYSPAEGELFDHLLQNLNNNGFWTSAFYLSRKMKNSNVLVLLDGLDEVSDPSLHEAVINRIKAFSIRYTSARVVVSSRIAGYERLPGRLHGFAHTEVLDFNDDQIRQFVYSQLLKPIAATLVTTLQNRRDIRDLTVNPLLLSATIALYQIGGRLPEKRIELYESLITLLLERWRLEKGQPGSLVADRSILGVTLDNFSLKMLSKDKVTFTDGEIIRQIHENVDVSLGVISIADLFRYIEASTGLLRQIAKNTYTFWHLSFQEFFAARALVYFPNTSQAQVDIVELLSRPTWLPTALFWASMADIEKVVEVLNQLPDHQRAIKILSRCVYETKWTGRKITADFQKNLIQLIGKTNNWSTVSQILTGITHLNLIGTEDLFEQIIFGTTSWQLRWVSVENLYRIASERAIEILLEFVKVKDVGLLPHVYRLLGRILDAPKLNKLIQETLSNNYYTATILLGCLDRGKEEEIRKFLTGWSNISKAERAAILVIMSQCKDLNTELLFDGFDQDTRLGIQREFERMKYKYPSEALLYLEQEHEHFYLEKKEEITRNSSSSAEESDRLKNIHINTVSKMRRVFKSQAGNAKDDFMNEIGDPRLNPVIQASVIRESRLLDRYNKNIDLNDALNSTFPFLRKEASLTIGYFKLEELRNTLIYSLETEQDLAVAAAMAVSLLFFKDTELISSLIKEIHARINSNIFLYTFQALLWSYSDQISAQIGTEFLAVLVEIAAKPEGCPSYLILARVMENIG